MPQKIPIWLAYLFSLLLTFVGISLHYVLSSHFSLLPFILAYPSIFIVSTFLGLGPALFSTVVWTFILSYFYFLPLYSIHVADFAEFVQLCSFGLSSTLVCYIVERSKIKSHLQNMELLKKELSEVETKAAATILEYENQLKDQFIGTLSHDLRNPLAIAKLCTEMILKKKENPERVEFFASRSIISLGRIDMMVMDLLDSRSICAGNPLNMKMEGFELSETMNEIKEDFCLINSGRLLITKLEKGNVFWSKKYIKRALENLLSNALKYGDASKHIELGCRFLSNGNVDLWVNNFGNVMSSEEIEKIFTPFVRISSDRKNKEGWGIGLTLINAIVSEHRGMLTVTSEEESGTCFKMSLPADSAD